MENQDTETRQLRDLFGSYRPTMEADNLFMARLESRLDGLKLVEERLNKARRATRRAILAGIAGGFAAGVTGTLLLPKIALLLAPLSPPQPAQSLLPWLAVATLTLAAALGCYRTVATYRV